MWHPYEMQPSLPTCHQTSWTKHTHHTLLGVLDDTRLLRIVRTLVDVLQINSVTFLFESECEELSTFSLTYSLPLTFWLPTRVFVENAGPGLGSAGLGRVDTYSNGGRSTSFLRSYFE